MAEFYAEKNSWNFNSLTKLRLSLEQKKIIELLFADQITAER
jgi:hypothetical protein